MNSDEIQQFNDINSMIPKISHNYKKSMINPKQFKPSLEIQLPDQEPDILQSYASKIKQDSSTHKTSAFLPNQMISPNSKKDIKVNKNTIA
jgi:hypothetical protein